MITREKTVKEFEIVSETKPQYAFTVRADTPEKAARKLIADLRVVITEVLAGAQGRDSGELRSYRSK